MMLDVPLPPDWTSKRLKYVATYNDEVLPESTDYEAEIDYVEISGVSLIGGIEGVNRMPFHEAPSRARRRVQAGDILVSTVRTYLKAIATVGVDASKDLIASTGFCVIRPSEAMDSSYLGWVARSEPFIGEVGARSVGVSYPAINASDLVDMEVPIPPKSVQQRIARFLEEKTARIDALIEKKQALLERLGEERQALITRAVTKGLNPDVPTKPSKIGWVGDIPHHWDVKPLKWLAKIGNGSTPSRDDVDYWSDGYYPWLNSSVVNQTTVTEASDLVTELALKECHLPKIKPPAVLIGITGQGKTRGMASLLAIEATINQHIAYLKPEAGVGDASYMRHLLTVAYAHLRAESDGGGSTKGAITCEQLGNLRVPVPEHDDQVRIAAFIDEAVCALDRNADLITRSIELQKAYRSALITAAVTGQLPELNG